MLFIECEQRHREQLLWPLESRGTYSKLVNSVTTLHREGTNPWEDGFEPSVPSRERSQPVRPFRRLVEQFGALRSHPTRSFHPPGLAAVRLPLSAYSKSPTTFQ